MPENNGMATMIVYEERVIFMKRDVTVTGKDLLMFFKVLLLCFGQKYNIMCFSSRIFIVILVRNIKMVPWRCMQVFFRCGGIVAKSLSIL